MFHYSRKAGDIHDDIHFQFHEYKKKVRQMVFMIIFVFNSMNNRKNIFKKSRIELKSYIQMQSVHYKTSWLKFRVILILHCHFVISINKW